MLKGLSIMKSIDNPKKFHQLVIIVDLFRDHMSRNLQTDGLFFGSDIKQ